ncbi:uncharacterized protein LOC142336407 [Convolutriloba macropyga]|uniref:uncharacterized protein LOC142336407 n=1 Tax=Convolutriloba macropyga TaxID=536237 RepID=UPI003F51CD2C
MQCKILVQVSEKPMTSNAGGGGNSTNTSSVTTSGIGGNNNCRLQLNDSDDEMLQDTPMLRPPPLLREDSNSDLSEAGSSSPTMQSARRHWKKGAVGFLSSMLIIGTIGGEVIDQVKLHGATNNAHEAGMREQQFAQKEKVLAQLNLAESASRKRLMHFVYDTGILSFTSHGSLKNDYATVTVVKEKSYPAANQFCSFAGSSLAQPTNFQEYQAIAVAARTKGRCYIGPTRNFDGITWQTQNGNTIALDNYWHKGQPSKSVAFSCVYILSLSNQTSIYSSQCNGDDPSITCFICERPQQHASKLAWASN